MIRITSEQGWQTIKISQGLNFGAAHQLIFYARQGVNFNHFELLVRLSREQAIFYGVTPQVEDLCLVVTFPAITTPSIDTARDYRSTSSEVTSKRMEQERIRFVCFLEFEVYERTDNSCLTFGDTFYLSSVVAILI